MARTALITLLTAMMFGFVFGDDIHGFGVRRFRADAGPEKTLIRITRGLAYQPSDLRIILYPAEWKEKPVLSALTRAALPWLITGIMASMISDSILIALPAIFIVAILNIVLFSLASVHSGITSFEELYNNLRLAMEGGKGDIFGRWELIGVFMGLGLGMLGAIAGALRFGIPGDADPEKAFEATEEKGSYESPSLLIWLKVLPSLLRKNFQAAAEVFQEGGNLNWAVRLLIKGEALEEAASIMKERGQAYMAAHLYSKAKNREAAAKVLEFNGYARKAAEEYEMAGLIEDAGRCLEITGDMKAAAESYRRGGMYDRAAKCFIEAREYLMAVRCFAKVGDYERAARIAESNGLLREAAEYYEKIKEWELAASCLERAGDLVAAKRIASKARDRESFGDIDKTKIQPGRSRIKIDDETENN